MTLEYVPILVMFPWSVAVEVAILAVVPVVTIGAPKVVKVVSDP